MTKRNPITGNAPMKKVLKRERKETNQPISNGMFVPARFHMHISSIIHLKKKVLARCAEGKE